MPVFEQTVKGKQLAFYAGVQIFEGFPYHYYVAQLPNFSPEEQELADLLSKVLSKQLPVSDLDRTKRVLNPKEFSSKFDSKVFSYAEEHKLHDRLPTVIEYNELLYNLQELLKKHASSAKSEQFASYVIDQGLGFLDVGVLLRDPNLEEIMVNGFKRNVFVFHKQFGMCKTNISVDALATRIFTLADRIAKNSGREFSAKFPLMDARLPDGSRANATFPVVSPFGPTITIRKFNPTPYSIIDLLEKKTLSPQLAGFLWTVVEGLALEPLNVLIIGSSSSGKTTTLNCLSEFIPYRERVITIEDTIELQLGARDNWVQLESSPETAVRHQPTMDELLKNAMRMRPDRLVVGEVRGSEALTLFTAMDTGHQGVMGTLHANSAKETVVRLKNDPMSVPEAMIPLLDLIVVQYRQYAPGRGLIRRVSQVAEVSSMDERVLLSNLYEWDRRKDVIAMNDIPSHVLETLSERAGFSKKDLMREMIVRQRILEWMLENKFHSVEEVEKVIQAYYVNPKAVIEMVAKGKPEILGNDIK